MQVGWLLEAPALRESNKLLQETSTRLTTLNLKNTGKHSKDRVEWSKKDIELKYKNDALIRERKAFAVYEFLKNNGVIYQYRWITREYVLWLLEIREKYKHLAKGFDYDTFDSQDFYLLWMGNESWMNPSSDYIHKNEEGSIDRWIFQMNECHYNEKNPKKNLWCRARKLFPELKNRPDSDVELNCVVWHLWMGEQKTHSVWLIWCGDKKRKKGGWKNRKDIVQLYEILKRIR
jgi:hypothetical protein